MKYRLFSGMSGGFGGARYQGTFEFDNREQAEQAAYQEAEEEYQSYEGMYGILDWYECRDELKERYGEEPTDDDVDTYYTEEMESWIEYYIQPAPDDAPEWEEDFD